MDRLRGGQIRIGCASGLGTEFAIAISGTSRLFPCARACPSVLREGWGRGKREATPASLPGERDKKDSGLASERERDHRRRLTDRDGDGDDLVSPFPMRGRLDMGPNHFFSNSNRVEFSIFELNRAEFSDSNFESNRTEGDRTKLPSFFLVLCPLYSHFRLI